MKVDIIKEEITKYQTYTKTQHQSKTSQNDFVSNNIERIASDSKSFF